MEILEKENQIQIQNLELLVDRDILKKIRKKMKTNLENLKIQKIQIMYMMKKIY